MTTTSSVLIVGGGLTGLSAALFLARRGVRPVVVERHPTTSIQYKFAGISPRSMEIYRQAGVEDDIRRRMTRDQKAGGIARVRTLADPDVAWDRPAAWADTSDISPITAATLDQDRFEPLLRERADAHGAEVRFNAELVALEQNAREVRARVRRRASGLEEVVRADWLVAADGASGTVRETLGIGRHGAGDLQHWMNVIFEADLPTELDGRRLTAAFVTEVNGSFVPREGGRWLMALPYHPGRGERAESFTADRCVELIRAGAGRPDLAVRLVDARPWTAAAYVADRYREGRAFLIGDAAHLMPPTGAFGGNTGIHDAHNLAWKLDAVIRGAAGPRLLETYDAERRPIAERTLAQALARLRAWFRDPERTLPETDPIVPDERVVFGYRYGGGAIVPDAGTGAVAFEDPRAAKATAGLRAPQLFVEHDGERKPILDLCDDGAWALFAGRDATDWCNAVRRSSVAQRLPVRVFQAGREVVELEQRWSDRYGVADSGAVLVRPDHVVAWRATERGSAAPAAVVGEVLAAVAG